MYIEKFVDCSLFADNAKLSRYVSNQRDSTDLQKGFCALKEWSDGNSYVVVRYGVDYFCASQTI